MSVYDEHPKEKKSSQGVESNQLHVGMLLFTKIGRNKMNHRGMTIAIESPGKGLKSIRPHNNILNMNRRIYSS